MNYLDFGRNGKKQKKHVSVELHLLVLLKYMGAEGNGCSTIYLKHGLGIRKGSVTNYLRRAELLILCYPSLLTQVFGQMKMSM